MDNQYYLFKSKRFLPLFITQICGCFNDNLMKSALTIMVVYQMADVTPYPTPFMILIASAIFIVPFCMFAGISGEVADKYERSTLVRIIKICELFIVCVSIYGFYHRDLFVLYFSLALMGVHSTFYGPLKYSILPDHLKKDELLGANGFVEAGTFISILIGTMVGSLYNSFAWSALIIMFVTAVVGIISSFYIPRSNNYNPGMKINYNFLQENINIMRYSASKKIIFMSILGISWFWFIGATFLSQIPNLSKDILGADENVATMFLAVFAIGVGVGSFWCTKVLDNDISTKYLFLSAMGISLFGIDLFFATKISAVHHEPEQLKSILVFLSKKHNWRVVFDLFVLSSIAGLYAVPLFAIIQYFSSPSHRSRVIAANNLYNAIFMIASSLLLTVLFALNFTIPYIILLISLLNILVAIYIYRLVPDAKMVPDSLVRAFFKFFCDKLYKVEIKGLENLQKAGKRAVIVSNHISYLDPILLGVYIPEKVTFAINTQVANLWWVKPFLKFASTYPIDPNNAMSAKTLINEVKKNKKLVIFPEGRISTTGSLMKVYEGPGMIADKSDAVILPVRIDGPQYTHFARLKKLPHMSFFPQITISIMPPVKLNVPEKLEHRSRRKYISQKLYDVMSDMMFESSDYKKTFYQSLLDAAQFYGYKHKIIEDIDGNSATYRQLIAKSFILGDLIAKRSHEGEALGLMLPNTVGTAVSFFAMHAHGRVPAMINFTSGASTIISACQTARVKTIFTSRKFIEKAELEDLAAQLAASCNLVYLEDLRAELSVFGKIKGAAASYFPDFYYKRVCAQQDDTKAGVILFTSGTEGQPKAVVLSHRNILANKYQIMARLDFGIHDIAFNTLPLFHCFGMTGMILMVLQGIRTFFYPSPLHYRIIPEVIYDIGATIMFATDTFLHGYGKYAHPYDFCSLRYVFAGAEKLKSKTRNYWLETYGVRILEGYGATETSPVISVNTSMHNKTGTVGRLMPKMSYRILPVEGIDDGGLLCLKGPNIMLGYMMPDKPGVIVAPKVENIGEYWYNTGDVVDIDDGGYIKILGRVKRFAKVAGEMVSLTAVEEVASNIDSDEEHAAVHILDEQKGEQIFLLTSAKDLDRDKFLVAVKKAQISELHIPRYFIYRKDVPLLATGKIDYRKVLKLAEEHKKSL